MEIVLATGNPHKQIELQGIFPEHRILIPRDLGLTFEFEETGSTFLENSLGKARALYDRIRRPVMADDSGLCVDALNGAPGIYSARFGSEGGRELSSPERNALLLETMKEITDRTAFFVCVLVMVLDDHRCFTAQETIRGEIIRDSLGTGGFGYDPLFHIPSRGMTMAQLSPEEKNRLSHRGRAGARMAAILESLKNAP